MDSENTADEPSRGHRLPRSLLVDHTAELLGVSRRTVYNRIHEGRLKTIRTRSGSQRVLRESLEALLRETRESKGRGRSDTAKPRREAAGRDGPSGGSVANQGDGMLEAESLALQVQALARDAERPGGGVDLAAMLVQGDLDHLALDFRQGGH